MPLLAGLLTWLVSTLLPWVVGLAGVVFLSQTQWFQDQVYWLLDQAFTIAIATLNSVGGELPVNDFSSQYGALPAEIVGMATLLHFPRLWRL